MGGKLVALAVHDAVAVVDIGTSSIRMQVAELLEDGQVRVIDRARRPVFLGRDTFVDGRLSAEKMRSVISILRDFLTMLQNYDVRHVRVLATSAVQEAANADAFIDRVYMATGLDVELIEPLEELRMTGIAVRNEFGERIPSDRPVLVLDVGGGNALVAVIQSGLSSICRSYPLGAIRMLESMGIAGERNDRACDILARRVAPVVGGIANELELERIQDVYVVGGEMRFLAEAAKTDHDDETRCLSLEQLDRMIERCAGHRPEGLSQFFNLPYEETLTLPAALLTYRAFLRATSAKEFTVSNASMRDGVLREMSLRAAGLTDPVETESLVRTAWNIADKYLCHIPHVEQVARLSLSLFDQLQPLHGLGPRMRVLLQVASLLHDVGTFVSSRAHHKHSYYIIANSEFLGLSATEKELVAQIARYHRRSCPKSSHRPYMILDRHRRMEVCKLAAILRVADALDRSHTQVIREVRAAPTRDRLYLNVECQSDVALEKRSLKQKADLLADIFGLTVQLNVM